MSSLMPTIFIRLLDRVRIVKMTAWQTS